MLCGWSASRCFWPLIWSYNSFILYLFYFLSSSYLNYPSFRELPQEYPITIHISIIFIVFFYAPFTPSAVWALGLNKFIKPARVRNYLNYGFFRKRFEKKKKKIFVNYNYL